MQQPPTPPRPQIVASDAPEGDLRQLAHALATVALAVARRRVMGNVLHFPRTHDTDERAA